jgi:hypothetical protein
VYSERFKCCLSAAATRSGIGTARLDRFVFGVPKRPRVVAASSQADPDERVTDVDDRNARLADLKPDQRTALGVFGAGCSARLGLLAFDLIGRKQHDLRALVRTGRRG